MQNHNSSTKWSFNLTKYLWEKIEFLNEVLTCDLTLPRSRLFGEGDLENEKRRGDGGRSNFFFSFHKQHFLFYFMYYTSVPAFAYKHWYVYYNLRTPVSAHSKNHSKLIFSFKNIILYRNNYWSYIPPTLSFCDFHIY